MTCEVNVNPEPFAPDKRFGLYRAQATPNLPAHLPVSGNEANDNEHDDQRGISLEE